MSRKDYIKIAAVLNGARESCFDNLGQKCNEYEQTAFIARNMAHMLGHDNPNFDRARFLAACGFAN